MLEMKLRGFEALERALAKMGDENVLKILRGSLRKGAKVVLADAKERAPEGKTGDLREGLKIKTVHLNKSKKNIIVEIANTKSTYYAKFLEFGTKHISARPFMRPALDNNKNEVLKITGQEINKRISRFFKRLKK